MNILSTEVSGGPGPAKDRTSCADSPGGVPDGSVEVLTDSSITHRQETDLAAGRLRAYDSGHEGWVLRGHVHR